MGPRRLGGWSQGPARQPPAPAACWSATACPYPSTYWGTPEVLETKTLRGWAHIHEVTSQIVPQQFHLSAKAVSNSLGRTGEFPGLPQEMELFGWAPSTLMSAVRSQSVGGTLLRALCLSRSTIFVWRHAAEQGNCVKLDVLHIEARS